MHPGDRQINEITYLMRVAKCPWNLLGRWLIQMTICSLLILYCSMHTTSVLLPVSALIFYTSTITDRKLWYKYRNTFFQPNPWWTQCMSLLGL